VQGIFEGLLGVMKETLKVDYNVGIAFVSQLNVRSLHAHTSKLSMTVIYDFEFNRKRYHAVAFRVK
jgi:hypothetical protein